MTSSDFVKSVIALACWRAAQSELHTTMLAVCMVFINRAQAGYFNSDLYENCAQWLKENPGDFPDTRDPQFQQMLAKLDSVTSGMVSDRTGGALWFYPKDQLEVTLPKPYSIVATIGGLVFVR